MRPSVPLQAHTPAPSDMNRSPFPPLKHTPAPSDMQQPLQRQGLLASSDPMVHLPRQVVPSVVGTGVERENN